MWWFIYLYLFQGLVEPFEVFFDVGGDKGAVDFGPFCWLEMFSVAGLKSVNIFRPQKD